MKQWEVIKELTEDPTKVFTDGQGNYLKFTDEGLLSWHSLTDEFCGLYTFQRDDATNWQLVRQPVTWQEAIQAWVEGKTVVWKRDADGDHSTFKPFVDELRAMENEHGVPIRQKHLNSGKWYVED